MFQRPDSLAGLEPNRATNAGDSVNLMSSRLASALLSQQSNQLLNYYLGSIEQKKQQAATAALLAAHQQLLESPLTTNNSALQNTQSGSAAAAAAATAAAILANNRSSSSSAIERADNNASSTPLSASQRSLYMHQMSAQTTPMTPIRSGQAMSELELSWPPVSAPHYQPPHLRQFQHQNQQQQQSSSSTSPSSATPSSESLYHLEDHLRNGQKITVEEMRLRHKRERNRRAAANCRRRKEEKIRQLEEENSMLKREIEDLKAVIVDGKPAGTYLDRRKNSAGDEPASNSSTNSSDDSNLTIKHE